jgi:hypothetical protein
MLVRVPQSQTWSFAPGRRLRITGSHYEYYCHTQFAATAITDIGSGTVPAPVAIGKGLSAQELERWEGVVVSLSDVTVTGLNSFDDAETDAGLLIDNQILGAAFVTPPVGEHYTTLRGLIVWVFDLYRIAPRNASDY